MADREYSSFIQWYKEGHLSSYVRTLKSPGGILNMLEALQPAGDMSDPAVPDLILYQDIRGGSRVSGSFGGGRFDVKSEKGGFFLAAPNFANNCIVDTSHQLRSVSFPLKQWQHVLDEAVDGAFSFDRFKFYGGTFNSPVIRSALQSLWTLCDEEGAPSRLLARAAGCEIMAELCRMAGTPLSVSKGGLAPWAKRRCIEMLRARLSEDISLDELSAEVRLSPYHFSRMFKQSFGVPPRVYLTQLRVEKACDLLELTDASITAIAMDVGYSSNQVLARVFTKHRYMSPTDYRRAVRDPTRSIAV
ncbi:AraC family transcriptional regulator [Paracoccus liaowanqingii]|uniref:AraC family transcriptional regulator n=1 Tax=Paracoccus liaowanqingii TaxID=2560053 RepID=A0A4Z1CB68_9RHOB|nr:AraC family transcriptional regulator [Paracoccus liaowanqingii]TGN57470.1 AraC family transcriptional regulator [Paracoccus liaowanqingii]